MSGDERDFIDKGKKNNFFSILEGGTYLL